MIEDERHRAINACPRIPARALFQVLQTDFQQVVASLHERRDIYPEGVVAVSPETRFLAVDINRGFCHGSVEQQFGMLRASGNVEGTFVVALANPGQCS